ncbi:MAG: transcriptional regulator/sugar kinase [Clostridiales bacterium]|jgi:glucokinase-like ROK family protein|nr:transcriptional regulator/sugar kinase [Clostridiales bacterium]
MTKHRAANNKYLRKVNETELLDLIRIHKSVSRAELSNLTGLSPTAIGVIVLNLLDAGYIIETGSGESNGGRRPVMLELKPKSFYSVGVDMDVNYINLVLMDITGEVIKEKYSTVSEFLDSTSVIEFVANNINEIIKEQGLNSEQVLGVGVSIPGMVDSRNGIVTFAPNLMWENVNVKQQLTELLGISVFVENESMASAIGENWVGLCQGVSNFICINSKSGIGSGIFISGKPYRGVGCTAGEIGHIVIDDEGPKCGCGNYGCLETMVSSKRMVEKASKLFRQGVFSRSEDITDAQEITLDYIISAAREGDETAKSILNEAARYLGIAISNLVNTLNPEKIILGKEFVKYADLVMSQIQKIVETRSIKKAALNVQISESKLGERASMLGAAIIPIRTLFKQ